jgi:hypothetical protein
MTRAATRRRREIDSGALAPKRPIAAEDVHVLDIDEIRHRPLPVPSGDGIHTVAAVDLANNG